MAGEMIHDLNFTVDVFDIFTADKLTPGDRFTSEMLFGFLMSYQVGNAKLTTAEFTADDVS